MTTIDITSAEKIFELLDSHLGFFKRSKDVEFLKEGEKQFYLDKKKEVLDFLHDKDNTEKSFWFQGFNISSASLRVNTTEGVHGTNDSAKPTKEENACIEKVNQELKKFTSAMEFSS